MELTANDLRKKYYFRKNVIERKYPYKAFWSEVIKEPYLVYKDLNTKRIVNGQEQVQVLVLFESGIEFNESDIEKLKGLDAKMVQALYQSKKVFGNEVKIL